MAQIPATERLVQPTDTVATAVVPPAPALVIPQPFVTQPVAQPLPIQPVVQPGLVQPVSEIGVIRPIPPGTKIPEKCHPTKEGIKCPVILYIILVIIGAVILIFALLRLPPIDRRGDPITGGRIWLAAIVGFVFYLIVSLVFGWWVLRQCLACQEGYSWVVLLIVVLLPLVLVPITGLVIGSILGVGFIFTSRKEAYAPEQFGVPNTNPDFLN